MPTSLPFEYCLIVESWLDESVSLSPTIFWVLSTLPAAGCEGVAVDPQAVTTTTAAPIAANHEALMCLLPCELGPRGLGPYRTRGTVQHIPGRELICDEGVDPAPRQGSEQRSVLLFTSCACERKSRSPKVVQPYADDAVLERAGTKPAVGVEEVSADVTDGPLAPERAKIALLDQAGADVDLVQREGADSDHKQVGRSRQTEGLRNLRARRLELGGARTFAENGGRAALVSASAAGGGRGLGDRVVIDLQALVAGVAHGLYDRHAMEIHRRQQLDEVGQGATCAETHD